MENYPKSNTSWIQPVVFVILVIFFSVTFTYIHMNKLNATQKKDYEDTIKINNAKHNEIVANLKEELAAEKNKYSSAQNNLYLEIDKLKTDQEVEVKTLKTQKEEQYNSLTKEFQKKLKDGVRQNGFAFVFGITLNEPNKKKIQDTINQHFYLLLSQKCAISINLFYIDSANKKPLQDLLDLVNEKLSYARGLTGAAKFKIPPEDGILEKSIKSWDQSHKPTACY